MFTCFWVLAVRRNTEHLWSGSHVSWCIAWKRCLVNFTARSLQQLCMCRHTNALRKGLHLLFSVFHFCSTSPYWLMVGCCWQDLWVEDTPPLSPLNKASYRLLFTALGFFCFVLTLQEEPLSYSGASCPPCPSSPLCCCGCVCVYVCVRAYLCASLLGDTTVVSSCSYVHFLTKWDLEHLRQVPLRLRNSTILLSEKHQWPSWRAHAAWVPLCFQNIIVAPSVHSRSQSNGWRQDGGSKARRTPCWFATPSDGWGVNLQKEQEVTCTVGHGAVGSKMPLDVLTSLYGLLLC